MSVYRRLARSKKGMSSIFGGLFFVILILMGFNVMLWGFVQWDSYNHVIATMSQRDQLAVSENILPVNSTYSSGTGTFNIWVDNLGGSSVNVVQIYINNVNTTGNCQPTPCYAPSSFTFSGANIPAGSVNYPIHVQGFTPAAGTQYHITLASTRGRLFTLYYPWRFNSLIINNNGGGGNFVTNVGPLAVYFDFKSFNYTQGTQTVSQSAFCMPPTSVVIYVRIANLATDGNVTLESSTLMEMEPYTANGFGQFVRVTILDPRTVNPSAPIPYSFTGNPYVLQPSGPNGPSAASYAVVKFGVAGLGRTDNWLTFIGIYYVYKGQPQGETIPFMDFQTNSGAPNCFS